jgi:hypothetical protein
MKGAHLAPHEVHALLLLRRPVEDARHALARARSMLAWPAPQHHSPGQPAWAQPCRGRISVLGGACLPALASMPLRAAGRRMRAGSESASPHPKPGECIQHHECSVHQSTACVQGTRARSLCPAALQPPKDAEGGPEPRRTSTMMPMDCVFKSFSITGLSVREHAPCLSTHGNMRS